MRNLTSLLLTALLAGCGSPADQTTDVVSPEGRAETAPEASGPEAVQGPDEEGAELREEVPGELVFDAAEQVGEPECEPGSGCFLDKCAQNSDCLSGWCVEHMGESVCTVECIEECPDGWSCKPVGTGGPDMAWICVSVHANLCRPCAAGADCKTPSGVEDVCLDYGGEGSFCGGVCVGEEDCPWGFSCKTAVSVDGVETKQCVAVAGVCPCTEKSVALTLATPCQVANAFGTCQGKRVCSAEGLGPCDAMVPAEESCNGLDDNCDGDVDEPALVRGKLVELCDDGHECTEDLCLGDLGCDHAALSNVECKDGNSCTVADHCEAGLCVGKKVDCDDENPCTDDSCDEAGGCFNEPNQDECDDGEPCTVADQCDAGLCAGVSVACDCQSDKDCLALDDGDACNGTLVCNLSALPYQCKVKAGSVVQCPAPLGPEAPCLEALCNPLTGACSFVPANPGAACTDGNACTINDLCEAGACVSGPAANCNDANPCTDDACDTLVGCQHKVNAAPCNDGDPCTTGDVCAAGGCAGLGLLDCDDGNACTDDVCVPGKGCAHTFNLAGCSDGNACTTGDHCAGGKCVAAASLDCNDGNVCTADACAPSLGCKHDPVAGDCSDGDACTVGEACKNGACVGGQPQDCGDGNVCTDDVCTNGLCVHAPNTAACDDGNACTVGDACKNAACQATGPEDCDDGNLCTDDACDPKNGCVHVLNQAPCDDGDVCTLNDKCSLSACKGGPKLVCNDSNPCTQDACVPAVGCTFTPAQAPCDDGNACTTGDHCVDGQCKGGQAVACNDSNPCTDDVCDLQGGCVFSLNQAACDDGDVCTVADACAKGACVPGKALDCEDGNPCTDDSCKPGVGCVHVNNGAPCDDGNACSKDDACKLGSCVPGPAVNCDDTFPCTSDGCDFATGCTHQPFDALCDDGETCTDDSCSVQLGCIHVDNQKACDDQNACTVGDGCGVGKCKPGAPLPCNDGNACTADSCLPASGCSYVPVTDGTACGQAGWSCVGGTCVECPNIHGSQEYNYTGGTQTFNVPLCVTKVTLEVWGGQGGGANCCDGSVQDDGGKGGYSKGTLAVTPGQALGIYVGGKGVTVGAGGWNGGGQGGQYGAGGGGASDVRAGGTSLNHRVIVAGGGGGGNCGCPDHGTGGAGGGTNGSTGSGSHTPGGGGTQNAGGSAGDSCSQGSFGNGAANGGYHMAGGGGGWYGGGCAYASGGGGGSGYLGGVQESTTQNNVRAGHGRAVVTW
jgi:hypothetical protein